jgi:hypothetical protein
VGACVGHGCVVVYLGPSATPVCVSVAKPPRVCTADLIESFGVCQDPATGCIHVWAGPGDVLTLCPKTAARAAPAGEACTPTWGIPLTQVQACTTHDGSGAACIEVTKDRRVVLLACDPTTGSPS